MTDFDTEYKKLNQQQRKAVDTIDGPLLVIAGPGTGKTQLLSARVANILAKTDTNASNILCLTFTNKAATNMRDRLTGLVGSAGRSAVVKTFHSFAAEIMNMYPEYFWNGARLSTAPDAVQLEIIQDILTKLPLDNPLAMKFAGQFTGVKDVRSGLKLTKEAGLTPEKLHAIIQLNEVYIDLIEPQLIEILSTTLSAKKLPDLQVAIQDLPEQGLSRDSMPLLPLDDAIKESLDEAIAKDEGTNKSTNTSAWKRRWIQSVAGEKGMHTERKRNAWWKSLADVYQSYRDELHARGYYDYSDMLVEVISQLEQRADLRAEVQERFLYVLIDEFQDTNAAQLRLAHLVSDHHTAEGKPNLMVVGDDDQSIYKFNGAELNNMLSFRRTYPATKQIVLTENYRSSQQVLDTAAKVIEHAEDRLVKRDDTITKDLVAKNPPKQKGEILHKSYASREEQLSAVAQDIKTRHGNKANESIAVIARGHGSLQSIAHLLIERGVPVRYEKQRNILDHELINQVALLADVVLAIRSGDTARVDYTLSQLIRHPAWKIKPDELWQLAAANFKEPAWLDSLRNHENESIQAIANWLLWLSQESSSQPLPILIEHFLGLREGEGYTSPLKQYFISDKTDKTEDYLHGLSAIQLLRTSVTDFSRGSEKPDLEDLLRFIELNRENGQVITDESPFVINEQAVQLLTVHKAKGLEFDTAYIIDAIEDNWQPRTGGKKAPANLPLQPHGDDADDYARLMYVAVTRAKHSIIATSYYYDHAGEDVLPTPLIRNAIDSYEKMPAGSVAEQTAILEDHLRWPSVGSVRQEAYLRGRLETYNLSVTHLLNFLDITSGGPAYFVERNLLRLPEAKTTSLAFGTAMHAALQEAQLLTNTGTFNLDKVKRAYVTALKSEYLPAEETERYIPHGEQMLDNLFTNIGLTMPKGSKPEQSFKDIALKQARLSGKLDRIDVLSKESLRVIDYKTGNPLRSFETKDKNLQIKAWKQKTQLKFYAVLLKNSPRFGTYINIEGAMMYLQADSEKDLIRSYTPTKEDIAETERLIDVVWQRIMKLDFPDTSSYEQSYDGIVKFQEDLLQQ